MTSKNLLMSFLLLAFVNQSYLYSQKLKETKTVSWTLLREEEVQGKAWTFIDEKGQEDQISLNSFIPGIYSGIPTDSLTSYTGQKLDIDFVFLRKLCSESVIYVPCSNWVATSIRKNGTVEKSKKKFIYPTIGKLFDPQGYVNIRKEMNLKSDVIGTLTVDAEQYFYFYPTTDPKWMKVIDETNDEGASVTGYIYYSRIR